MSIYDSSKKAAKKLIKKFTNPSALAFEELASVSDGLGGTVTTWSTKFTCAGAVLPLSASEQLRAMQLNDESTAKAYIEYTSGVPLASDRLLFKGKLYNITGVLNVGEADAVHVVYLKEGVVT